MPVGGIHAEDNAGYGPKIRHPQEKKPALSTARDGDAIRRVLIRRNRLERFGRLRGFRQAGGDPGEKKWG